MISKEQQDKLHYLIQRIRNAQAEVWEAYETTMMSDAKTAVYSLKTDVEEDQSIDPVIKNKLMPIFTAAWTAILRAESTENRAMNSHAILAEAETCLKRELSIDLAT